MLHLKVGVTVFVVGLIAQQVTLTFARHQKILGVALLLDVLAASFSAAILSWMWAS